MPFEINEISKNAAGGTELMRDLLSNSIEKELLENFQIFMSRVRERDDSKIRIVQLHDLPEDPESEKFKNKAFIDSFHKLVFVSNWQYQRYQMIHGIPYDDKCIVIENGIIPAPSNVIEQKPKDKINLVYTSTPQRGLEILVPVFEHLSQKYDDIHLDVFSSFKIYGWEEADKQYQPLYDRIQNHPKMTYHGFVSNDILRKHLLTSHILAYPSIWLETSCRAMLEAMSSGLLCVHPNYGALHETSGGLNVMYQGNTDKTQHANIFAGTLEAAIKLTRDSGINNMLEFNKMFIDGRFSMDRITNQWTIMLKGLLNKYPTIESRKYQNVFTYNTGN